MHHVWSCAVKIFLPGRIGRYSPFRLASSRLITPARAHNTSTSAASQNENHDVQQQIFRIHIEVVSPQQTHGEHGHQCSDPHLAETFHPAVPFWSSGCINWHTAGLALRPLPRARSIDKGHDRTRQLVSEFRSSDFIVPNPVVACNGAHAREKRAAHSSSLVNSRRMMRAFNVMFGRCAMRLHAFSNASSGGFRFHSFPSPLLRNWHPHPGLYPCARPALVLVVGRHADWRVLRNINFFDSRRDMARSFISLQYSLRFIIR